MSKDETVRSLIRGLEVLQAVNRHATFRASDIAKITDIPRPTVYRLLETLETLGFVARGATDGIWRPTLRVKTLSSGFRDEDWVAQNALPRMLRLGKEVLWPLDLVAFSDFRMLVRESTHALSPYSIDHGMVGRQLPILETSGGRAFLAFSEAAERAHVLKALASRPGDDHALLHDTAGLDSLLARCRDYGLGFRVEGFNPHTKSISAPIIVDRRVICCMTMIWIGSAMRLEEALDRFGPRLRETAADIARSISASRDDAVAVLPIGGPPQD
ncbi:MAG: helix-turn-helix domain-containing protein [Paracoccus sp. (in: a-proteobacteria)]